MPAQIAPPMMPNSMAMTRTNGPGPPSRTPTYAARHDPITSWPSWPMLTRPARLLTMVPSATSRIGAVTPRVVPHRPGLRMLPSSMAVYTFVHEPPVAATQIAARARATNRQIAYRATTSPVTPNFDRCFAAPVTSACSGSVTARSPTSATGAAHHQTELGEIDFVAAHLADDPSVGDHDDAIGEVEDLLQVRWRSTARQRRCRRQRAVAPTCTRSPRRRDRESAARPRAHAARATARGPARPAAGCPR